jgi:hypothetical protein
MIMLKKKTIESVVASFQQTVNDLEQLAEQHNAEAEVQRKALEELQAIRLNNLASASRASTIADKIKGLLS